MPSVLPVGPGPAEAAAPGREPRDGWGPLPIGSEPDDVGFLASPDGARLARRTVPATGGGAIR